MEAFLWASGIAAIGGRYLPGREIEWGWTIGVSSVGALVWKIAQIQLDLRLRELDQQAKDEAERLGARAKEVVDGQAFLTTALRETVEDRLSRILDALAADARRPSIQRVQDVLAPRSAVRDQLERLAAVLQGRSSVGRPRPNIRVGLYLRRFDHMVPVAGVDLRNPGYNPFTSFSEHRAAYECVLTKESSHVVRSMVQRGMIVVEDCIEAAEKADFWYSHEAQRSYLRSMVAYHLGEVVDQGGASVHAVVAADSDCRGVFRQASGDLLEETLQEFGLRIRLEMALQEFLTRGKGVNP